MTKKELSKHKIEVVYLNRIVSLNHSFRDEFTKNSQHCIELYYDNDQILYLACYDNDQIKKWQACIKKGMLYFEWLSNLQSFVERDLDKLTEQSAFKLNEIIHFVQQYSETNEEEIVFTEKEKALAESKKAKLMKLHQIEGS